MAQGSYCDLEDKMAASIIINEWNGTVGTQSATSKSGGTIRFKSADNAEVDSNDPLIRPNSGVYRSYEKWLRCYIEDLEDATSISNLEVFTTSRANTGVAIYAATFESFCDAEGDAEHDPSSPRIGGRHSENALPNPKTNLFAATSAAPIQLGDGPFSENEDDGDIEDAGVGLYLVLQMEVSPSAVEGQSRNYAVVLRYDEE